MKRGFDCTTSQDKNTENPSEPELLCKLIQQNKFEAALEVLDKCTATELNTVIQESDYETTLLAEAVAHKNLALIERLIAKGADIHLKLNVTGTIGDKNSAIFRIFDNALEVFDENSSNILKLFIQQGASLFTSTEVSILSYFLDSKRTRTIEEYQSLADILGDAFYTHLLHIKGDHNHLTILRERGNTVQYEFLMSQVINYFTQHLNNHTFQENHVDLLKKLLVTTDHLDLVIPLIKLYCLNQADAIFDENLNSPLVINPYNEGITHYPVEQFWRLFVDADNQKDPKENGWQAYETREPGCIQNMWESFVYAIQNSNETLSFEHYLQIHEHAAKHLRKGLRSNNTQFGFILDKNLTFHGLLELIAEDRLVEDNYIHCTRFCQLQHKYKYNLDSQIINNVKKIIEDYNHSLTRIDLQDRVALLKNIIRLASNLDRCHPHHDGNTRTAQLVLNRELYKHGFPLVILDNPNQMDGFSQNQLFEKIIQGMKNFFAVIHKNHLPGAPTNEEILDNLRKTQAPEPKAHNQTVPLVLTSKSFLELLNRKNQYHLKIELPLKITDEQINILKLKKSIDNSKNSLK